MLGRESASDAGLGSYVDLPLARLSPQLLNAIEVAPPTGPSVTVVPTAGAQGVRSFNADIPGVEVVCLSPLHTVPLEALQIVLEEEGEAVVRVKHVQLTGGEPRALIDLPGYAVGECLGLIQGFTATPDIITPGFPKLSTT